MLCTFAVNTEEDIYVCPVDTTVWEYTKKTSIQGQSLSQAPHILML